MYDVRDRLGATETVCNADLEMCHIGADEIGADENGALQKPISLMSAWVPSLNRGYMISGLSYRVCKGLVPAPFDEHRGFLVYDLAADCWTSRSMPITHMRFGVPAHVSTRDD